MKTISFVIPFYNEEERIKNAIKALRNFRIPQSFRLEEVIFVNDGSSDRVKFQISNFKYQISKKLKIKIISYKQNRGKGYAVREGMNASNSDYTLFFDVDISTPLTELKKFIPFIKNGTEVIIGTRKNNGKTKIFKAQPIYRQLLGKGFTNLSNLILGTNYLDFTCGFKTFKNSAKNEIFEIARINRFGFDAEILFLTKKLGFSYKEIPVNWRDCDNSKVNLIYDLPRSLFELLLIRVYDFLNFYQIKIVTSRTLLKPTFIFSWVVSLFKA